MPIAPRTFHTKYELNTTKDKIIIEVSLWLPWELSYHSNEVCVSFQLSQRTSIPNVNSARSKTKELLRIHSGCHGS